MKALPKEVKAQRESAIAGLTAAQTALQEAVTAYNDALSAAAATLAEAVDTYNDAVSDFNGVLAEIADVLSEYVSDRSEKWQESEAAEHVQEWIDAYQTEAEPVDAPEPDVFEVEFSPAEDDLDSQYPIERPS